MGGACRPDTSSRLRRPGVLLLAHLRAPARPVPFPRGMASALPRPPGGLGEAGAGLPRLGSRPGSSSARFSPPPRRPRASRGGFRGAERRGKERKSRQTAPSGGPSALRPPRRPVSAGAARSGRPAPALGSAGPHARPAWAPGPGPAALDGPRTKPRGTARPRLVGVPRAGGEESEPPPHPPQRAGAPPNLTRGAWKKGAGAAAGSPAVAPALSHPTLPTQPGRREPEPRERRAEGGERSRGAAAQRPGPSGEGSGALLAAALPCAARGALLAGNSVREQTDPLGARQGAVRQSPFSTHPGARNVQTVSGIFFPAGAGDILFPFLQGGFSFLLERGMREVRHDSNSQRE